MLNSFPIESELLKGVELAMQNKRTALILIFFSKFFAVADFCHLFFFFFFIVDIFLTLWIFYEKKKYTCI